MVMPTPECWEELGALRAEVDTLRKQEQVNHERIRLLEDERVRLKTIGAGFAFLLTGLGVFFSDPIRKFVLSFLGGR